ncbi:hypothetical protein KAR29_08040 [Aminithiophilus ramosus]|uniref:Uncharacterized protein n=2 Tax=Synergistales TaxID=649776 RepID=A0A9Q7A9M2_9BACT|nr:hypothetical protein [Aminithiophilus ramosus]QTX31338.1 hypothetical protein KAR29_08040 [Aminithiophilus ramosus]QVL35137.1 hypothetical protein KIH16_07860 [Synergistota bacterium]
MLERLEQFEKILDKVTEKVQNLEAEKVQIGEQLQEARRALQEKDLELIRVRKENQRLIEQAERERMSLQKEKDQMEQRLSSLAQKLDKLYGAERPLATGGAAAASR